MNDIRRYSLAAIVLLVVLRLSLGWQLLYEGLWKIDTLSTPKPWTSAGYLKNSTGPLRPMFREMAGDPDDLDWLDYDVVANRWKKWAADFKAHFRLSDGQKASLDRLLNGAQTKLGKQYVFAQPLEALPSGIETWPVSPKIIRYDATAKRLYVSAERFMTASERAKLEKLVTGRTDEAARKFLDALKRIDDRQKKGMGYLKKLAGALNGNPELLGNEDWQRLGKKDQYIQQLKEYEERYAEAATESEWDHLAHTWGELQTLRSELSGPIKAMQDEFYEKADGILTLDQHARGEMPVNWTSLKISDMMTIIGLTALGIMLLLGLFSRFTCITAGIMLFSFYLAMPPFPGTPPQTGPEHSFIINKTLIEAFALFALAAIPTGRWFGLDSILAGFLKNWSSDKKKQTAQKTTVEVETTEPKTVPAAT